eukprot:TRINITY_DN3474_c0_g1_i28.p1 TRINITY_DN3474_c0_g1~~TRINITY_DN3474_c0_g1_i28.p1  ORF type:complete len:517 (-),score=80.38 TRINITY_DN3474_c0_g1_i28:127-1677(-)
MSRCAVYGAKYGNGGLVANQACCACGGGSAPFCPMDRYLDPDLGKCTGRRPIICRPVPQLHLSADPRLQCTSLWRRVPAPELPFVSDSPAWWASLPLLRGYPDATSAILTSPWLKLPRKAELRMEIAHSMEEPLTTPVRMTAGTDRQPYGRIRNPLGCAVDSLDAAAVWWRDKNTSNGRGHSDWHTLESHDLPYNGNKSWGLGYSTGRCGLAGWTGSSGGRWKKGRFSLEQLGGKHVQVAVVFGSDQSNSTRTDPGLVGMAVRRIEVLDLEAEARVFVDGEVGGSMMPSADEHLVAQQTTSIQQSLCRGRELVTSFMIQCSHDHLGSMAKSYQPGPDYLAFNQDSEFGITLPLNMSLELRWASVDSSQMEISSVVLGTVPLTSRQLAGLDPVSTTFAHVTNLGFGLVNARLVPGWPMKPAAKFGWSHLHQELYTVDYYKVWAFNDNWKNFRVDVSSASAPMQVIDEVNVVFSAGVEDDTTYSKITGPMVGILLVAAILVCCGCAFCPGWACHGKKS